jgi:hypothetical protein
MKPAFYQIRDQYRNDTTDYLGFNFKVWAGDPEVLDIESRLDLSGIAIKLEFRQGNERGKIAKTLSISNGLTVLDPINGEMTVDPFIVNFVAGTYFYDIQLTYPSGRVKTYIKGEMIVKEDTTK